MRKDPEFELKDGGLTYLLLFALQSSLGTEAECLHDLSMPLHPAVLIVIKVLRIARPHLPWFYCGIKVRPDGQRPPTVRKEAKVAELSFTVLLLAVSLIDGAPLKFCSLKTIDGAVVPCVLRFFAIKLYSRCSHVQSRNSDDCKMDMPRRIVATQFLKGA